MTVTPSPGTGYEPGAPPSLGTGYDPDFLPNPVPLPSRTDRAAPSDRPDGPSDLVRLDYVHFTVVLDTVRRLAALTAVNIDGDDLTEVDRGDDWHLDPRLDPAQQTGPALYASNDLDRGHLVRRRDPVWGPPDVAERANFDTFAYPNAAPQAAGFNQSLQLWLGLEDHVLAYALTSHHRLSVFTGPVLAPDDPTYRGIQIPRRFYKIAAWTTGADRPELAATGYLLDQTPQLDDIDLTTQRAPREGQPPPLGPFRSFQIPISDVATLTSLDLGPLTAADRLEPALRTLAERATSTAPPEGWIPLAALGEVRL